MNAIPRHLNDEHMQLYEWHGAGTGMQHSVPVRSKRSHPWHASNAVLALLTSLLIVNGYDSPIPPAKAGERLNGTTQDREPRSGKPGGEPGPTRPRATTRTV